MNLELLEQFGQNYPEEFDGVLDCFATATSVAFNRRGSVLAVGCNDGLVFIWDFLTRGVAKMITAHVLPVTSLSWSRNGKLLATSSNDCYVYVWDVLKSQPIIRWHLNTCVSSVQFSPRNHHILLIHSMKQPSHLVQYQISSDGTAKSIAHSKIPHDEESEFDVVSSFDRRGEYVFSGNTKGRIQVIRLEKGSINFSIVTSFRVSNTAIKQIEFAPKNKNIFLVNSADRIIRVYDSASILANDSANTKGRKGNNITMGNDFKLDPEPIQKLQDLVNRTIWKKCCFSGGAESDYICAGSSRQNSLYIWERNVGTLLKILHGTKGEVVCDVIWHPIRPVIVSIASGVVSIWSQAQIENWSAFAPDFKELEENIEYEEKESEFDDYDEDKEDPNKDMGATDEEDAVIDVVTPHSNDVFLSSDEEQEDRDALVYFPISVDMENVELDTGDENFFDETVLSNVSNIENNHREHRRQTITRSDVSSIDRNNVCTIQI
ncbi:retinoblastoma binding protein 5 [Dermatophagoides pteronyssinus]|uniref:Retinoblastoma-binding protein 5 n=2 Tax=Dermatophagoides pteronyssinus TaxID=6956 RepID=A0ABQ8JNP3_DERPT|nr:retinoblastoma-binding protein 5 homolog [Dermatophagoides pteronyssinus]KAH9424127.1 Retinoblastoma-binding protein 5 [Dermatophagoides pteronyssinus]